MSLAVSSLAVNVFRTAGTSVLTKAPGSIARMNDVWDADSKLKQNTINGELFTLAQVGAYGGIIRAGVSGLQHKIPKIAQMTSQESWLSLAIAVVSSGVAEIVSRKFFNRKIDESHHLAGPDNASKYCANGDDDHDEAHLVSAYNPFMRPYSTQQAVEPVLFAQKNRQTAPCSVSPLLLSMPAAVRQAPFRI